MKINVDLIHWLLVGPFLMFLGYYRDELHPGFYRFTFTVGIMTTAYYFYKWINTRDYMIKNIY